MAKQIPLTGLSDAQRKAFQLHLNDLYDDYEDAMSSLALEAKYTIGSLFDEYDAPLPYLRDELTEYSRQANRLTLDYYANVRAAWQEITGMSLPDYEEKFATSDRAFWQIVGGFSDSDMNGLTFQQVINGLSRSGYDIDYLWQKNTAGYTQDQWMQLAREIVYECARLTQHFTSEHDPTKPRYARVPQGAKTCAFCLMLASRGYAYWTKESAGGYGHSYHHDCDCLIVPAWGSTKIEGYNPSSLYEKWEQANKTAAAITSRKDYETYKQLIKDSGTNEQVRKYTAWKTSIILQELRRLFPDEVKDGVNITL